MIETLVRIENAGVTPKKKNVKKFRSITKIYRKI